MRDKSVIALILYPLAMYFSDSVNIKLLYENNLYWHYDYNFIANL